LPVSIWPKLKSIQLAGKPIDAPPAQVVSHEEVLEVGQLKAEVMRQLVEEVAALL
jgi:purine-nucleoside phosphorylase